MFPPGMSLRLWLLVAMIGSAAVGLGGATLLFGHVQTAQERRADAAKARQEARTIAGLVRAGAGPARLAAIQELLVSDRITVERNGQTVFRGPPRPARQFELRVQARFPGGVVRVDDYATPASPLTLDLTLITAGALALVIAAAIATATLVARAVRRPVERAIEAADRVSHGQFDVRIGTSGPEELAKLGGAFDEMAARLERAERDQRRFLADVAHEIATPLNAVSGFALALADGAVEGEQQRDEARALIEVQTARLRDLLTDLRALTQLDLAEGVRIRPISLRPFADRLVASFRPEAREAGLELSLSVSDGEAQTDLRLLETIASNLVSNAIRYTDRGGSVKVDLRRRGDQLLLRVMDTGVGIAPEHQKRIFERLYRVDSTRDRATGGSGLGLAIVRRAVHTLGGQIELHSTPGKGSEFSVTLPARTPPSSRAGPEPV